jgi:hypothetical protein
MSMKQMQWIGQPDGSLSPGFEVKQSTIPGAGLGLFVTKKLDGVMRPLMIPYEGMQVTLQTI